MRKFISGNEALAHGVRLARPHVISAYPITPQTTVVEHLALSELPLPEPEHLRQPLHRDCCTWLSVSIMPPGADSPWL